MQQQQQQGPSMKQEVQLFLNLLMVLSHAFTLPVEVILLRRWGTLGRTYASGIAALIALVILPVWACGFHPRSHVVCSFRDFLGQMGVR